MGRDRCVQLLAKTGVFIGENGVVWGSGQHHQRALGLTFPAHNPKVVSSNLTPATMGAARLNLKAPFFLLVACRVVTLRCSVRHCSFLPIPVASDAS